MRRRLRGFMVVALAVMGALLLPAPALAADADDFWFSSFVGQYRLGVDDDGRSVAAITETLVAQFPEEDQNRGIRRAIVQTYDGHPTEVTVTSVTDENGTPREYEEEVDDDGFLVLTIRGEDYVHGQQTYVIDYTQHNVILYPDDAAVEEFYWEANGTGWAQSFERVTATVYVPVDLVGAMTGSSACYQGDSDSNLTCESLTEADTADGGRTVTAVATGLTANEGLTVGVGFQPGTFVPRDSSYFAGSASWLQVGATLAAVVLAAGLGVRVFRTGRNHPGRGLVIPEYSPPKDLDLFLAADVAGTRSTAATAQFLDDAVRGHTRIIERVTGKKPQYALQLLNAGAMNPVGTEAARAVFGPALAPGSIRELGTPDPKLSKALHALTAATRKRAVATGVRRPVNLASRWVLAALTTGAAILGAVAGFWLLGQAYGGLLPLLLFGVVFACAVGAIIAAAKAPPLTEQGALLRDHLRGMKEYISLAEADRLRMLQSPPGAERSPLPTEDDFTNGRRDQIVVLNEKLLPYAVLFGLEKKWSAELATSYEQVGQQPSWYSGSGAFNAAVFSAGISGFSSSTTSSWSGTASSSSHSGSGGGGSVGGGGGGGGGGGV